MAKKSNKKFLEEFITKYFKQIENIVASAVAKILKVETKKLLKLIEERAVRGEKGDKSIAGIDFDIPQDGKDADPKEVAEALTHLIPEKDTAEELVKKLNTLEKKLDKKVIKGLAEEFQAIRELISDIKTFGGAGGGSGDWITATITGAIDGSNTTYTLSTVPPKDFIFLFVNGQKQRVTNDFTLSGNTIEMQWTIPTGSTMEVEIPT